MSRRLRQIYCSFGVCSFLKASLVLTFCIGFLNASASTCPCPTTCSPCQGGITKLTLVYTGEETAYIQGWDRRFLLGNFFSHGDTIQLRGSLPNSLFRGNAVTMIVDGGVEPAFDVRCDAFEILKPVGSFIMIAAESMVGGPVCCPAELTYDNVGPEFLSLPEDMEVDAYSDCGAVVAWTDPIATDCSEFTVSSVPESGSVLPVGETTITVTATDARNNQTTTTFKIHVRDVASPVFTYCPDNIAITTYDPAGTVVNWQLPIAMDNCGKVELVSSYSPDRLFAPGLYPVTYTARDAAGNSGTCSFTITVNYDPSGEEPPPGEEPFPIPIGELNISKIITPNGDGINDVLEISNIEYFPANQLIIFDRWGNAVFEGKNYDNINRVWPATAGSGAKLPTGTYFYSIVLQSSNRKRAELRGFVELIN